MLRTPFTVNSFTPTLECGRTTPPISVLICVNIFKLVCPNCAIRYRKRYALELPKNEQLKQPSASVIPDNQKSLMVGVTRDGFNSITCALDFWLKASKNKIKLTCLRGNTRFPLKRATNSLILE